MEDNTASKCICAVAAIYDCTILRLFEYQRMSTDTKRSANDTPKIPVYAI